MKKVGIFTLNGYNNFGNRLQNYAVEQTIISLDYSPITILVNRQPEVTFKNKFIITPNSMIRKIKRKIHNYCYNDYEKKKTDQFICFSKKYLNESDFILTRKSNMPFENEYSFFIVGSDQVWNPYNLRGTSFYFLDFTKRDKKIAFAPSFGLNYLPDSFKHRYYEWLSDFKYLSVRENSGAKIIKELLSIDVEVLVDPTLLLTKNQWIDISKPSMFKPKKKYLLTYFLGKISKEKQDKITKLSFDLNLEVVRLSDIKDKKAYTSGPSEFIDYINSAELFFTDSFHGVVFSILMQTPFVIYKRITKPGFCMYSRIETLLDMFNFEHREERNINFNEVNMLFDIDFSHTLHVLEKERDKSIRFLREALNID